MKRSEIVFGLLRIPVDSIAACIALLLAYQLRIQRIDLVPSIQLLEEATTLPAFPEYFTKFATPGIVVFLFISAVLGLYVLRSTLSAWQEIGRLFIAALLWLVVIMAWYFFVQRQLFYSRILLLHTTIFLMIFAMCGRALIVLAQRACLRIGIGVRHVVSVGGHTLASPAKSTMERDARYTYLGHCTNFGALREMLEEGRKVDMVLQTDPHPGNAITMKLINYCRSHHISYGFLPPVLADVPQRLAVEHLGLVPMVQFRPTPLDGWGKVLKRLFDIVMSIILLLVLFPIFLLLGLCILLTMGWPIFYVSQRIGEHASAKIPMVKFRSMVRNAERQKSKLARQNTRRDGPLFKLENDPRITPVGRVLRRFDLDELPQLFNVLLGHMSLVGPRPHLPEEVERYRPYERRVFAVRPGMTGLAQVSGRSTLSFRDEVRLDLRYIEEWSPLLDLWILWRTIWVVLNK